MSADILGTSWDQCVSMVQYCFMSTETIRLFRTERPGRPPWLSHSSWTLHIMCRDHRIYVLLRSRQTSVCDFSYLSIAETTRFLHPLEKQEDRCLRLQLYSDFSYLSAAETTRFLHLPEKQADRCLRLQLSIYTVTSVICLFCDFSYLSIAETARFLCPPEKQAYSCLRLQLFICSRDHKISTSSGEAGR